MIHIDDLVRQRLGGGQEPERPGGWLNMKELLDKEMPMAVATGNNRRRIIGYFTGLLLLATASVGGYQLYHYAAPGAGMARGGNAGGAGQAPNASAVNTQLTPADGQDNSLSNHSTDPGKINTAGSGSGITGNSARTESSLSTANGRSAATASTGQSPTNSGNPANRSLNTASSTTAANSAASSNTSKQRVAAAPAIAQARNASTFNAPDNTPVKQEVTSSRSQEIAGALQPKNNPAAQPAANAIPRSASSAASSSPTKQEPSIAAADRVFSAASGSGSVTGRRTAATEVAPVEQRKAGMVPVFASGTAAKPATAPAPLRQIFDTIETIEIVRHRVYDATLQKSVFRLDTFPKRTIVVARVAPATETAPALPTTETASASGQRKPLFRRKAPVRNESTVAVASKNASAKDGAQAITPAAKPGLTATVDPAASADNNIRLEALSKHKVSSKKFLLWDAAQLDETVNKFKFKMASIQMYPGVMAGINASVFSPNSLGGFQVGLTTLFVLNDWWSLMTELKYLHRFNTGSTLRDNYMAVKPGSETIESTTINGQPYTRYTWQEQHVDHYFNYEVVQTFEMPLALRRSWGRVYTQGGINLVYSLPITASEVTRERGDFKVQNKSTPASAPREPYIWNNAPTVKSTDFGARFGTGYVLGAGFMFTPAVYMDVRVAQTFWDNAKTQGAKQISNDLLRTPSVQLSVGYRFGQRP